MHYPIIHQVSFSRSFSEAIDTLYDPYFHFCCYIASTGNLSWEFFHQAFRGSWPLPHPLINELTIVRALRVVDASPNWKLSTVPEMEPLQRQRSLFSAKTATMWTACHDYAHIPPPIPPFCYRKTYHQNRFCQLITCIQSCMTACHD